MVMVDLARYVKVGEDLMVVPIKGRSLLTVIASG
jgi:hypothetical protein